ncbi:hypothetical protein U9M48_037040, partial [Paspalum notatum var. saurae]
IRLLSLSLSLSSLYHLQHFSTPGPLSLSPSLPPKTSISLVNNNSMAASQRSRRRARGCGRRRRRTTTSSSTSRRRRRGICISWPPPVATTSSRTRSSAGGCKASPRALSRRIFGPWRTFGRSNEHACSFFLSILCFSN